MKIILSDAKTMREAPAACRLPAYHAKSEKLLEHLLSLNREQLKKMWKCSDTLCDENIERLKKMNLQKDLTPAILAYQGQVFQHLDVSTLDQNAMAYLNEHLVILSGFYGCLRADEGVRAVRLEMGSTVPELGRLYAYWEKEVNEALRDEVIINLASKEFSAIVHHEMVNIRFVKSTNGKETSPSTYAKTKRGEMLRWLAVNQVEDIQEICGFDAARCIREGQGFCFKEER